MNCDTHPERQVGESPIRFRLGPVGVTLLVGRIEPLEVSIMPPRATIYLDLGLESHRSESEVQTFDKKKRSSIWSIRIKSSRSIRLNPDDFSMT